MVKLNPLVDFSVTPITRHSLFDAWSGATIPALSESDLSPGVKPIVAQSSPPTEAPGRLWWSTREQLMFVYTDELEGTGVSLWLSIGPDRLDTACLAAETIAAGAPVDAWFDRYVKVAGESISSLDPQGGQQHPRILGVNQSGVHYPLNEGTSITSQSGAWMAVAIEGMPYVFTKGGLSSVHWVHFDHDENDGRTFQNSAVSPHPDREITLGLTNQDQPVVYDPTIQPNFVHYHRILWGVRRQRGID